MTEKKIKAWHFMDSRRGVPILRDGNTAKTGYIYSVEGPLEMCAWGLHQSRNALDALTYAPGPVVGRCIAWGDITEDCDKFVSRHREYLWIADATDVLRHFARLCALDAVHMWDAPDVVVRYLKTGDNRLRIAARGAAWAAWTAPYASRAARAASRAARAAWAASDAARAAWAARAATREAGDAASHNRQERRLVRMLTGLKHETTRQ